MPARARVQYPADIEPLVQFIEETPPAEIVDRALAKLREGVSTTTMLTASALAVVRSSDLPPGHHGGPLHPLAGMYAIHNLSSRLEGEDRFLPILQHVALSNKHINDPVTSPFNLLEFEPLDASAGANREADLAADGSGDVSTAAGVEACKEAFLKACSRGESNKADHLFLWLWDHVPAIEAFDLLLSVALPKNALDDHYFLFPGYLWRGLHTAIGTEHLKVLMRPAVRYVARFPAQRIVPEVDGIIEKHNLLGRVLRQRTGDDETASIGALGTAITEVSQYSAIPELIAQALADGMSLEGAGEALSIGAAGLFMRSLTGNPMDVHLHTSANLRRYLLRLDGLSIKSKLLTLLLWHTGPEVKSTQYRMMPAPQPDPQAVAALPHRSQDELLEAITHSIHNQPPTDWSKVGNLGQMRAVPEVRETVNLAQQYVNLRYDPEVLLKRLGDIVCHDSFTEMHAFKHHQAVVEEFANTRDPWRWMHLVCGCQAAAISFGKNMTTYEEALELLHAA